MSRGLDSSHKLVTSVTHLRRRSVGEAADDGGLRVSGFSGASRVVPEG